MKKIFIISSVLLVVVIIFLGAYNLVFKKESPIVAQAPLAENVKKESSEKKERIVAHSERAVTGAAIDKKTQDIIYYDAINGTVWKTDDAGKEKIQVTEKKIEGLKKVLWSPDRSKTLLTIEKNGKIFFNQHEHFSGKEILLKEGLDSAAWDNIGAKIFYKYYDAGSAKRSLNISNPDGSEWQKIADIEHRNISISAIPLSAAVSFWNFPNANEESIFQVIGATGGEPKIILSGKFGADYLWSPDGSKALVSSLLESKKGLMLGIVSMKGEYQELGVPTFVSKCAWSQDSKTIYYTIPGGMPENAVIPNDYNENKFTTRDTFWKMNIDTGEKERIIEAGDIKAEYDASELFLSSDEDLLYFINKVDQKLYRIEL